MQTPKVKFSGTSMLHALSHRWQKAWRGLLMTCALFLNAVPTAAAGNLLYEGIPPWTLPNTDIKVHFRERLYFDTTSGQCCTCWFAR